MAAATRGCSAIKEGNVKVLADKPIGAVAVDGVRVVLIQTRNARAWVAGHGAGCVCMSVNGVTS